MNQRQKEKVMSNWIDEYIVNFQATLAKLRAMPPGTIVVCQVCEGRAPEPEWCGCGGTQTREEAIDHCESEIEILCK